jgi:thiol peroxidase
LEVIPGEGGFPTSSNNIFLKTEIHYLAFWYNTCFILVMKKQTVTFKGEPQTLIGPKLGIGDNAPYFKAVNMKLEDVSPKNFTDKTKLITSFPSLNTSVCEAQIKNFNEKASSLADDIEVIGISMDLPFAQQNFCDSFRLNDITLLSDYKYRSFAVNYGLLIQELGLLARSVLIIDKQNTIRYMEIVPEIANHPDYDAALNSLKTIQEENLSPQPYSAPRCKPCEGGVQPFSPAEIETRMPQIPSWQLGPEAKSIHKELTFDDFAAAKFHLDTIATIAEDQQHHPTITLDYGKLNITLTTHAVSGLTENDFIMAQLIDRLEE